MKKILVVDDSETLRTQVTRILSDAGFKPIEAEDGVKGLQAFLDHDVDLIICDVNMPEMDGLTMCERLSASDKPRPPIFMLTTESSADMKVRGKSAGVIAWVTKPFVPEKLLAAVNKVVS